MAPQRKRETRENQFYNVGVQGRKTGITLADRGVYDEHGLEPISGIFSSPEKSPPKRGGTATASASESMDMQESRHLGEHAESRAVCAIRVERADIAATAGSIPDLATAHQILRNSRTHLPPPRSRSPRKTALGSSPRRQSSMALRGSSVGVSSPTRAASHPAVARRLDFEHDDEESSLQDTPALSKSGKRASVYDIPEDGSPAPQDTVLEESFQEMAANEDLEMYNGAVEESSIAQIAYDTTIGANIAEEPLELDEPEMTPELVKEPAKRGRKRKSDALEPSPDNNSATKLRKQGAAFTHTLGTHNKGKKPAPAPAPTSRRSKRVSDIMEQEASALDVSINISANTLEDQEEAPAPPKRRGRPARPKPAIEKDTSNPPQPPKTAATAAKTNAFKKPPKPAAKPREKNIPKNKVEAKMPSAELVPHTNDANSGKLVDVHGHPLSKKDIEQMSTTSVGSRFGRGRHLSVFRELEPEAVARVGRTGRHRVAPIDFWKNDRIAYDPSGGMTSIVMNQDTEPERKSSKPSGTKGKKRTLTAIEEEELELDPWEEDDGVLVGNYRDFDGVNDVVSNDIVEDSMLRMVNWATRRNLTTMQKSHGLRRASNLWMSLMVHSSTPSSPLLDHFSTGALSNFVPIK
jgi:centromere protein C